MTPKDDPKKLVGEVQVFRIRVATAESKLKLLRDQARQAKRRRKEAKRSAQRARKQFKRSKAELAGLQEALAKAEVKLFQAGGRALARKLEKARPEANRGARPSKKPKAVVRKPRPASPGASRTRMARKQPAIEKTNAVAEIPASVSTLDGTRSTPEISGANS